MHNPEQVCVGNAASTDTMYNADKQTGNRRPNHRYLSSPSTELSRHQVNIAINISSNLFDVLMLVDIEVERAIVAIKEMELGAGVDQNAHQQSAGEPLGNNMEETEGIEDLEPLGNNIGSLVDKGQWFLY